jgi:hypothetical protein
MHDTTIKKVEADSSPKGEMGQRYLVAGKGVSMRLWVLEPGAEVKYPTSGEYETVGYVISGSAKLDLEGQTQGRRLVAGARWSRPSIHDLGKIHGCRGNCATGRGPWPRCARVIRFYSLAGPHERRT